MIRELFGHPERSQLRFTSHRAAEALRKVERLEAKLAAADRDLEARLAEGAAAERRIVAQLADHPGGAAQPVGADVRVEQARKERDRYGAALQLAREKLVQVRSREPSEEEVARLDAKFLECIDELRTLGSQWIAVQERFVEARDEVLQKLGREHPVSDISVAPLLHARAGILIFGASPTVADKRWRQ